MRLELPHRALSPITRTTFHIPAARIIEDGHADGSGSGRLLFWVRVFTCASVQVAVASTVPVTVGDAEKVRGCPSRRCHPYAHSSHTV